MSRFYVTPESVRGKKIYAAKEESHHIIDVMRLEKGDPVTVFDGTGREYEGRISSTANKKAVIDILNVKEPDKKRPVSVSLAQAMPKKDKMDLIVQKATELGIDEIIPVESIRTVVKSKKEKAERKIERWKKIALEASKQCGRADVPEIRNITYFDRLVDSMKDYGITIMPCLSGETVGLKSALSGINRQGKVLVIIGPEGGFSEEEIRKAQDMGAILVTLGNLVLKSDTAAIATLSILNYEYAK